MAPKTADELRGEDIIDTRDIIEAAAALREDIADEPRELDDNEAALLDFDDTGPGEISDYPYGETLIREDCFEDYARDLADDIGAIAGDESWPLTCIDWEKAARELAMDYSMITFLGYDYYVRS